MKTFLGILFMIAGIVGGVYVGGWMMFISPIIEACRHFDAGTLNAVIIGWTIVKCFFASVVGVAIAWVGMFIGTLLIPD